MGYSVMMLSGELYHHGILGQKWGVRNGPPYPLDAGDHSSREKKAGWEKSLNGQHGIRARITKKVADKAVRDSVYTNNDKFELTDKQKRMIKIGVGIAVAGLAAYGVYKVSKLPSRPRLDVNLRPNRFDPKLDFQYIPNNKEAASEFVVDMTVDRALQNPLSKLLVPKSLLKETVKEQFHQLESSYKWHAKKHIFDPSEIEKWGDNAMNKIKDPYHGFDNLRNIINPELVDALDDLDYSLDDSQIVKQTKLMSAFMKVPSGKTTNCMYCTTAFDLNKRGFKVMANERINGGLLTELFDMYDLKDDALMSFKGKALNVESITEKLSKYDNGRYSRGNMMVTWKGGGGHSVAWEFVDNELTVMDFQSGVKYEGSDLQKFLNSVTDCSTVRLDNAELKWSDQLLRALDFVN